GRELHRIGAIGQRQLLGEERQLKERGRDRHRDEEPPHSIYLSALCFFIRHSIDVVPPHGTKGTSAVRRDNLFRRNGSSSLRNACQPSRLWPMSRRASVDLREWTRSPPPHEVFFRFRSPGRAATLPASKNAAASTSRNNAHRDSALASRRLRS